MSSLLFMALPSLLADIGTWDLLCKIAIAIIGSSWAIWSYRNRLSTERVRRTTELFDLYFSDKSMMDDRVHAWDYVNAKNKLEEPFRYSSIWSPVDENQKITELAKENVRAIMRVGGFWAKLYGLDSQGLIDRNLAINLFGYQFHYWKAAFARLQEDTDKYDADSPEVLEPFRPGRLDWLLSSREGIGIFPYEGLDKEAFEIGMPQKAQGANVMGVGKKVLQDAGWLGLILSLLIMLVNVAFFFGGLSKLTGPVEELAKQAGVTAARAEAAAQVAEEEAQRVTDKLKAITPENIEKLVPVLNQLGTAEKVEELTTLLTEYKTLLNGRIIGLGTAKVQMVASSGSAAATVNKQVPNDAVVMCTARGDSPVVVPVWSRTPNGFQIRINDVDGNGHAAAIDVDYVIIQPFS